MTGRPAPASGPRWRARRAAWLVPALAVALVSLACGKGAGRPAAARQTLAEGEYAADAPATGTRMLTIDSPATSGR